MPLYTFIDKNTNEEYDKIMSYEQLIKYIKKKHIEQVFKIKTTRYSDSNGMKDQFTDWCKEQAISGSGEFKPYGKAKQGLSDETKKKSEIKE